MGRKIYYFAVNFSYNKVKLRHFLHKMGDKINVTTARHQMFNFGRQISTFVKQEMKRFVNHLHHKIITSALHGYSNQVQSILSRVQFEKLTCDGVEGRRMINIGSLNRSRTPFVIF